MDEAVAGIAADLTEGREEWLDPDDAIEMAFDLYHAGYRKVEAPHEGWQET